MSIKIEATDKQLSALGGLLAPASLFDSFYRQLDFTSALPSVTRTVKKFKDLVLGLVSGAECLDDWDKLADDAGAWQVLDRHIYTAKAYGDYLRSFSSQNILEANRQLIEASYSMRESLFPNQKSIVIDFDSTSHQQYGQKMEGVEYSGYAKINCLDSIHAFDEHGLQYWHDVRSGATHTAQGITQIVHEIFSAMPNEGVYAEINHRFLGKSHRQKFRRFARADAGYCNAEFFNACQAKAVGFVCRLRSDMLEPRLNLITNWKRVPKNKGKKQVTFYDGRECELGEFHFAPKGCQAIVRVVVIRALKEGMIGVAQDNYDYFAFVTNIGSHEKSAKEVVLFYRARGHAENFIKELKNGFDLHHYPCQKLNANRAFGICAAFAYNLMRYLALTLNPDRPQWAKAIRFRLINLPCQVVRHGREVVFRFMKHHAQEIQRLLKHLKTLQHGFT
jgi:hypothetical protein